jgi:hypothetical protein
VRTLILVEKCEELRKNLFSGLTTRSTCHFCVGEAVEAVEKDVVSLRPHLVLICHDLLCFLKIGGELLLLGVVQRECRF